ncbi:hypothetical protein [Mahella australiensis]|uniref:Uncharacterized protein n=1 Tax=Mahella australiensis (strain DSM 15567 / CIP 107919 / 50-1 BON) TaxID=697281 RepID=F3ZVG3_MAHA5|nr:hypothetical protein [Mahella australiensis]AEE95313.1 hypothetical protein Mahau_0090 [Mahella australiensis 50-1 BON]
MSDEIQEVSLVTVDIMPRNIDAEIAKAVQMRAALDKLFNSLLQQGIDFDRIPGTDKPTLLKPGAELLCQVFRLATGEPKIINSTEDFEKGILSYTISLPILHRDTGALIATGLGSANSQEVKYKYRNVEQQNGEKVKMLNPEPADQQNTLIKMAAKRAYIDGVLKATGASRMFTQDIEDMPWLEPEKASSKQINYIKMLFKGANEDESLSEISDIAGRNIKAWDEITRNEATKIIDAKKSNNEAGNRMTHTCSECGAKITAAEDRYSNSTFGKALCRTCQAKAKAAAN